MYGQPGQALGNTARDISPPKIARPTVNNTHEETIKRFIGIASMLDALLTKIRGSQPECAEKSPEEMPSVMANAGKLNQLAYRIESQVSELHDVIGE